MTAVVHRELEVSGVGDLPVPELEVLPEVGRPDPTWCDAAVVAHDRDRDRYWRLVLDAPEVAARTQPGQFVMLTPARRTETWPVLPRPMAVYDADPRAGTIEIVYGVVGPGTEHLSGFGVGEEVPTVGPLGRPFDVPGRGEHVLLLGRGIGVCSLTLLGARAAQAGASVTALCSGRTSAAVIGPELLRRYGIDVLAVDDAGGSSGLDEVASALRDRFGTEPPGRIAVCGSHRLTALAARLGEAWGAQVQVSVEAHMACGLGYCHGCATGERTAEAESPLVCRDGPVFGCVPAGGRTGAA